MVNFIFQAAECDIFFSSDELYQIFIFILLFLSILFSSFIEI